MARENRFLAAPSAFCALTVEGPAGKSDAAAYRAGSEPSMSGGTKYGVTARCGGPVAGAIQAGRAASPSAPSLLGYTAFSGVPGFADPQRATAETPCTIGSFTI